MKADNALALGGQIRGPRQVDSFTPRGKAAIHALLPAVAFLLGPPVSGPAVLTVGAMMGLSSLAGPRFSLIGRLFNHLLRPALRMGAGAPEPAAPHRFAEAVGAVFLLASGLAYLSSQAGLGDALALIVVGLALVNASLGICVGCIIYTGALRFRVRTDG